MRTRWKAGLLGFVLVLVMLAPSGVALSPYDILIVNDGHMLKDQEVTQGSQLDRMFASRYKDAIQETVPSTRIEFYNTTPSGLGPSQDTMNDYDLVVWYTLGDVRGAPNVCPGSGSSSCGTLYGDANDPFNGGGDIENVTRYLREDNGRLLIMGHQLHTDLKGSDFQRDILYTRRGTNDQLYKYDFNNDAWVSITRSDMIAQMLGEDHGPVVDGENFNQSIDFNDEPADWRDVIYETRNDPDNQTSPVKENMYWGNHPNGNELYALDTDGDEKGDIYAGDLIRASNESFKFITMGFGPEVATSSEKRQTLMRRSVNFLLGPRADANTYLEDIIFDQPTKTRIGEAGTVRTGSGTWVNVSFDTEYDTPVVIGDVNSYQDPEEAPVFEVRNVHPTWAEMRLCESEGAGNSNTCDSHANEVAGYLVIDAAKTDRVKGIEAGRFDIGGGFPDTTQSIDYGENLTSTAGLSDPVVVGSVQTVNGDYPIETRLDAGRAGFTAGLCHLVYDSNGDPDACDPDHTTETIGWVAVQPDFFRPALDTIPTMNTTPVYQRGSGGSLLTGPNTWNKTGFVEGLTSYDFEDEFQRSNLTADNNWSISVDGGLVGSSSYADIETKCTSQRAMHVSNEGDAINVTTRSFDLSSKSVARFSYRVLQGEDAGDCDPPEDGEDVFIQYLDSSGSWQRLRAHRAGGNDPSRGEFETYTFDLPQAALHANFKIRFHYPNANEFTDHWVFDDVEIGNASITLSEVQSVNGAQQGISTRSVGGMDSLQARFCELESGDACDSHIDEEIGWMAFGPGPLFGDLRDNPSYTNDQADVAGLCRNYQQVFGDNVRDGQFFIQNDTGIPANHRSPGGGYGLDPFDGSYDSSFERFVYTGYDAAGNVSTDDATGINVSTAFQCQDDQNSFNYWGPFERDWLSVDIRAPYGTTSLTFGNSNVVFDTDYTSTPETNITLDVSAAADQWKPDLVRFSCQQDGPWTGWKSFDRSQGSKEYRIDLTSPLMGCQDRDRNATVNAQIRDLAGNTNDNIGTDWIVLDREDPGVHSVEPTSNIINATDTIRVNASDNIQISTGVEAPNNTFFNGTANGTFLPNSSFDPGYSLEQAPADLTYTWYDTQNYYDANGHPTTTAEFDDFFDTGNSGVSLGGGGNHQRRIYWGTYSFLDNKPSYLPNDGFSWKAEGYIYAPADGTYAFAVDSDDASDVWVGGQQVVKWLGGHGAEDGWSHNSTIELTQGWHTFKARMEDGTGSDGLGVAWKRPTDDSFSVIDYEYFETSRRKQLYTWVFDQASNTVFNATDITLDIEAPTIQSIVPSNDSYIATDDLIDIEAADDVAFDTMDIDSGQTTSTTTSTSTSFDPAWSIEEWKNLSITLTDVAGNSRDLTYWYYVDGTPPVIDGISEANNTYINDDTFTINVSDARAGLGDLIYNDGSGNQTFTSGETFSTGWTTEGSHTLDLYLFDAVQNLKTTFYSYTLDTTDPSSFTNYTWPPQGAVDGWVARDVPVAINATDNFELDRISYCIGGATCSLDQLSSPGQNVSTTVSCPGGSTCQQYIRFRANDSASNQETITTTDNVSIDKELEEITFNDPSDGDDTSGTITLDTTIADSNGVGLQDVNYSIVASDGTTIYQAGDLNATNSWDAVWNSSKDISADETVTFNITAADRLGNRRKENISFRVDNAATTVSIGEPNAEYVPADFTLGITARRAGSPLLTNHSYKITEQATGDLINSSVVTGINADTHSFNFTVDTSGWKSDGNYTINSTAWDDDTNPSRGFDESWFYLDRVDPTADISGITNESWQRRSITFDYDATDDVKADSCAWRYRDDGGSWETGGDLSCGTGTFDFNTGNCNDDSAPDCVIEVRAVDAAGNTKRDRIWIRVDNTRPSVSFNSPAAGSWHASDIQIDRADSDNVAQTDTLTCQWRNGSGSWKDVSGSCDGTFTVDISTYCSQDGAETCDIDLRTINPAGWIKKASRSFSIDTRKPLIDDIDPDPSTVSLINESRNVTIRYHDPSPGSGVQYAYRNNGTRKEQLLNDTSFDPGWEDNGEYTLTLTLNDSADNLVQQQYTYDVDVEPPASSDPRFNVSFDPAFDQYRIYPGQPIRFLVNVTDNVRVGSVTATLNTSSNPVNGENISLSRLSGTSASGTWSFAYKDTDAFGTYNITSLFLEDTVQNRNATRVLPSFEVVDYSHDVDLGGRNVLGAGHETSYTATVDLNRSLTDPTVRLFVPPSRTGTIQTPLYNNTTSFSCTFAGSGCSVDPLFRDGRVAALNVTGSGEDTSVTVQADIRATAPAEDTDTIWRSSVQTIERTNTTTILAPDLEVAQVLCDGRRTCRTNQSEPQNVTITLANRNTSDTTGPINLTRVRMTNTSRSISLDGAVGNITTGNESSRNLTLLMDTAGNFTFKIRASDDFTGSYRGSTRKQVHIRDTEPPAVSSISLGAKLLYVNDSVTIEADATDNLAVEAVNVTLTNATGQQINVTLDEEPDDTASGIWSASFNRTSVTGFYNLTQVFVIDTYGNRNTTAVSTSFEVGEITTTIVPSSTTVQAGSPVTLDANVSGNITEISDINATIIKPREAVDDRDMERAPEASDFTVQYTNVSRSGTYDVNLTVTAGARFSNRTDAVFTVPFGSPTAEVAGGNGTHIVLPDNAAPTVEWDILPDGGDLTGVNTSLSFADTSIVNLTTGETAKREIGNVTYEGGRETVAYDLEVNQQGTTTMNLSVNTSNGDQRVFETMTVDVVAEDTEKPDIGTFDESPDELNRGQNVTLTAEATDNSLLRNLTVVIQHPVNGSNYTETPEAMMRSARGKYRYTFTNTTEKGHYTYNITAWDIAGNHHTVRSTSFDVFAAYNVNVTSERSIFKKNDRGTFSIAVTDVNGNTIQDYNATIVLEKDGSNTTLVSNDHRDSLTYRFKTSDPPSPTASTVPAPYQLYVNVSDDQNVGAGVYAFNVTRLLEVGFITPQQGDVVAPGAEFNFRTEIVGPNDELVEGLFYARCEQCPSEFRFLDSAGDGVFTTNFTAPTDEDSALIRVFASDLEGNSESQESGTLSAAPAITIDVGNDTATGGTGTQGGGGGGGFGPQFEVERVSPASASLPANISSVNLSVSTSLAADCRYTTRPLGIVRVDAMDTFNTTGGQLHWEIVQTAPGTTYSYNIYCEDTAEENSTLEVVFSVASETIASFGLFTPDTLPPDGSGVGQGTEDRVPFSVYNNGSEDLDLKVETTIAGCCRSWVGNDTGEIDSFRLGAGSERSLQLHVDVPLNTTRDTYSINMEVAESGGTVRERAIRFEVVRGDLIRRLQSLKNTSRQIERTMRDYRSSGIDVSELDDRYERVKEFIRNAEQAVANDDREVLENQLREGENTASEIEGRLRALALQNYIRENWWKWLLGGIIVYTIFFLLTMVAVPYYRLQTDLIAVKNKLESATEARKKAERQYFNRQIDRDTFMDIMTDRQDEILELRSERDDLQDDMDNIFENRLTAENYLKAPLKAIREVNRWIEARRTKIATEVEVEE